MSRIQRPGAWPVIVSAAFAVAIGAVSTLLLAGLGDPADGWRILTLCAACSAGVLGTLFWDILVRRSPDGPPHRRGALAGAATGLLVPAFTLVLTGLAGYTFAGIDSPFGHLVAGLYVGIVGLPYVGWLTVPTGVAVGYALGRYRTTHRGR